MLDSDHDGNDDCGNHDDYSHRGEAVDNYDGDSDDRDERSAQRTHRTRWRRHTLHSI
jgi:hypothetical protein